MDQKDTIVRVLVFFCWGLIMKLLNNGGIIMAKKSIAQQIKSAQTELAKFDAEIQEIRLKQKQTKSLIADLEMQQQAELGRQVMAQLGIKSMEDALLKVDHMTIDTPQNNGGSTSWH